MGACLFSGRPAPGSCRKAWCPLQAVTKRSEQNTLRPLSFPAQCTHALNKRNTVKGSNMYYVVSKALAARMQGSRIPPANVGGSVKGIFATGTKAASFLLSNKLQLTYTIVFL